ncbi:MAG: hypothetical protein HOM68_15195 [Gemmatimonadetes bacterium]|jgi:hypothetical protein|nr:hypothetical protein [Gemmatimonadota bacterium]MBT4613311.1 hypothetical protein [Gemmatimonadota bacterium]MBT5057887.1 hypothetical protein [Gemmatimonadota bacterium]MBT5144328.1 hypothetical protein [Gemmatimonadota bacterium]MBT5590007.1 hypothetical protein [Gemmatimonadota bacterium]
MADEIHQQMREDNSTRLRVVISALAMLYAMTFLGGFLQDTQYNFLNYIFFSFLFIGGGGLVSVSVKATQTRATKGFLFLTGISTTLLFIFAIGYEWFRLKGQHEIEASIEGLLYLLTLFFWVGVIGSLVLIRRRP